MENLADGAELLALWRLWRLHRPANLSRLHLVAHSAQPIALSTLSALAADAELYALIAHQYPPAIAGVHRLIFRDERLTLDLWFGDVPERTPDLAQADLSPIVVIGGGIAGLSMVDALTRRGIDVTMIEQDAPLSGGSGNPRALLLSKPPLLSRVQHNLQTLGGLSSARWWQAWADDVLTATGALLTPSDDDLHKVAGYPADMVQVLSAGAASAHSGMHCTAPQLSLPRAAVINPSALRDRVLASPRVTLIHAHVARLAQRDSDQWQLYDAQDRLIAVAGRVIVASAKDSPRLCPTLPPLTVIRGQMSWCEAHTPAPHLALGYGGYAVKFEQTLLLGSTFVRDDESTALRATEHQTNYDLLHSSYPVDAAGLPPLDTWRGRASLRALPRDSMPLVGAVPEMTGVYALTGMGSKGFSFAPLCGELIAGLLLGEPLPLPPALIAQLSPARFIKKVRVRKPYYTPPV